MPHKFIIDSTHDFKLNPREGLAEHLNQEWLLTNGSGAYAMGSVLGVNTRRYHGLLIASLQPPVGRTMLVNQMLVRMAFKNTPDQPIELGACAFKDDRRQTVHAPQGHLLLTRFQKGVNAGWTADHPLFEMLCLLRLHWKQQAATLEYIFTPREDVTLTLCPMVTLRDFHAMRYAGQEHGLAAQVGGDTIRYTSHHAKAVIFAPGSVAAWNQPSGQWWYNVHYAQDQDRGQADREDYYTPAHFTYELSGNQTHHLKAAMALGHEPYQWPRRKPGSPPSRRIGHLTPAAEAIHRAIAPACRHLPDVLPEKLAATLAIAADDFIVDRPVQGRALSTILAGYPWFADWGRDAFIALPGLLLTTGRHAEARDVLHAFASHIRNGLVPNRFDDYHAQDTHYNTVDASLWFIQAALAYMDSTSDDASWRDWLGQACQDIIQAYMHGTDYDIRMTGDGLITAGSPETQLTWMDAACDGVVFTPRHGKAVEINALWHSCLMGMSQRLEHDDAATAGHYSKIASRVGRSFMKTFWNDRQSCLFDHIWTDSDGHEHVDESLRPNQVLAASLPFSVMPKTRAKKMLAVVRQSLLTPVGLRTLGPTDPNYHSRYQGQAMQRDGAYHQGTVWPWLLGPFVQANLRVEGFSAKACKQAAADVQGLVQFIMNQSPGQLYEIHEADEPHRPVGCPAQAWSVAQLIQTLAMMRQAK